MDVTCERILNSGHEAEKQGNENNYKNFQEKTQGADKKHRLITVYIAVIVT
jgi:hypothetical protein